MRGLVLCAMLAVLPLAPLGAQQASTSRVSPGARVRVHVAPPPRERTVIGTVTTFGSDTLALAPAGDGAEQRIPLATIRQLEVSRGRGVVVSHVVFGAVGGAFLGGLLAGATSRCSPDQWICFQALAVAGGVIAGSVAGAGVGLLIKGERWRTVQLERVAIFPLDARSVGLSVGLRF